MVAKTRPFNGRSQWTQSHLTGEDATHLPVERFTLTKGQALRKRLLDVMLTCLVLVLALPLMGIIAVMIFLDSRGDVIFCQDRVGYGGRIFYMYKFRSMYAGAVFNRGMKQREDPRVTRVGRMLRRTSLDELPQLFNVLQGEMSLVGPRPEMPQNVELYYAEWQYRRFDVPQGMTGWWQINGRANRPLFQNTEDDLYYIDHYSLWLDLKILIRTVSVVINGNGAF